MLRRMLKAVKINCRGKRNIEKYRGIAEFQAVPLYFGTALALVEVTL